MSVNKVQEEELHVIPKLWVSGVEHPPSGRVQALSPAPWEVSNRGGGSWRKAMEGKVAEMERHVGERVD